MPQMIFIDKTGAYPCDFAPGETILTVAQRNKIDLEGSCGGQMACSTCHVIVDQNWFGKLAKPSRAENDLLDLAANVRRTSRLGCQIVLTDDLDGLTVTVA